VALAAFRKAEPAAGDLTENERKPSQESAIGRQGQEKFQSGHYVAGDDQTR